MVGKRSRKRGKSVVKNNTRKEPVKTGKEASTNVEKKTTELDSELGKSDKQSSNNEGMNVEIGESSNVDIDVKDFKKDSEANKYVPPFSRKVKRSSKRIGTPPSPVTGPKRPRRQVQQDGPQARETLTDDNDKQSKVNKEDSKKEMQEIDVVGTEKILSSQKDLAISPQYSVIQTTEESGTECDAEDGVHVIASPVTTSSSDHNANTVEQLLNDVLDAACQMVHCSQNKAVQSSESGNTHPELQNSGLYSLDTDINKCEKEAMAVTKTSLDCGIYSAMGTVSFLEKAATEDVVIEGMKEYTADNGSAFAKGRSNQSSPSASQRSLDNFKPKSCSEKHRKDFDHSGGTLQSLYGAEKYSQHEVDKDQRIQNVKVNEPFDLKYDYERNESQNPEAEKSAVASPDIERIHAIRTATGLSVDVDLELGSPSFSANQDPSQKNCQQENNDSLAKTTEVILQYTEPVSEKKMDTLPSKHGTGFVSVVGLCHLNKQQGLCDKIHSEKQSSEIANLTAEQTQKKRKEKVKDVWSEVPGCNIGDNRNDSSHLYRHQDLDQMVPSNEANTVSSSRQSDGKELKSTICLAQDSSNGRQYDNINDKRCNDQQAIHVPESSFTSRKMALNSASDLKKEWCAVKHSVPSSIELVQGLASCGSDAGISELDCLMDCTDSQLIRLDSSADQPPHQILETQKMNDIVADTTTKEDQHSLEVPSDNGMIKGLISELSALNFQVFRESGDIAAARNLEKQIHHGYVERCGDSKEAKTNKIKDVKREKVNEVMRTRQGVKDFFVLVFG